MTEANLGKNGKFNNIGSADKNKNITAEPLFTKKKKDQTRS
jgi:hypothetical protein